jgi:hypothetical protein
LVGYPWDPLPRIFSEGKAVLIDKNKQTHISVVLKYSNLARYGRVEIRLLPYHPEINSIERMWALVKNWVAMKNVTFQLQDVLKLAEEKFSSITKEEWLPVCKHVQDVQKKFIKNECLVDNIAEELFIILESSDSNMSVEDEDNSLEGILPLSSDSE